MNTTFARHCPKIHSLLLALALGAVLPLAAAPASNTARPSPVILDTDFGDDIDDTWALGLLLQCPELELKLVVGDYGKAAYRARLLAKFLETARHTEVAVGMGLDVEPRGTGPQAGWLKDYDLKSYPGRVHQDGLQALIDTIMNSPEPITLICIGPVPNIAAALEREPRIAQRARFVGMHGSVRVGYGGSTNAAPEWNVKADPKACAKVFTAPWEMTITPLDTCGLVDLGGERYQRLRQSPNPITAAILENYRVWSTHNNAQNKAAETHSSTLFDTVAVYLAVSQDLCRMERLGLRVTPQGFTAIDDSAKKINAAMSWTSLDGFRDWLVNRLKGSRAGFRP
jgi:inosine-uridine nucleoside N-ribohydrolase